MGKKKSSPVCARENGVITLIEDGYKRKYMVYEEEGTGRLFIRSDSPLLKETEFIRANNGKRIFIEHLEPPMPRIKKKIEPPNKPQEFTGFVLNSNGKTWKYEYVLGSHIEACILKNYPPKCPKCGGLLYGLICKKLEGEGRKCSKCSTNYYNAKGFSRPNASSFIKPSNAQKAEQLKKEYLENRQRKKTEKRKLKEEKRKEELKKRQEVISKIMAKELVVNNLSSLNEKTEYCSCILLNGGKKYIIKICNIGNAIINDAERQEISAFSMAGKVLLTAVANDDTVVKYDGKLFNLLSYVRADAVFVDQFKIKTANGKNNKTSAPAKRVLANQEYVYVYYKLSNICITKEHNVESVTLQSEDVITRSPVYVNAYFCKDCKQYFIDYDAVKEWANKKIRPCLKYCVVGNMWGDRKPVSELMLYGYNVKEGVLSERERHTLLGNIIQMQLLSKPQIINCIKNSIDFNGRKPGNERAKAKWETDLKFVHEYVSDNKGIINGILYR